jgi:hypothetical protein
MVSNMEVIIERREAALGFGHIPLLEKEGNVLA